METPIADLIVKTQTDFYNTPIIEIQPNQGFNPSSYQTEIARVGWYPGGEWCAFSAILGWTLAYEQESEDLYNVAAPLFSGNSQEMARQFHAHPWWPTSSTTPKVGAIVVWAAGDSTTEGHTGLVIAVDPDGVHFTTLEGNSIPPGNPGNEREGYTIAQHVHTLGMPHTSLGLNLDRFVYVVEEMPAE